MVEYAKNHRSILQHMIIEFLSFYFYSSVLLERDEYHHIICIFELIVVQYKPYRHHPRLGNVMHNKSSVIMYF